jgi:prepilin-type N-terminal cleavage/methylation domain-containing protein
VLVESELDARLLTAAVGRVVVRDLNRRNLMALAEAGARRDSGQRLNRRREIGKRIIAQTPNGMSQAVEQARERIRVSLNETENAGAGAGARSRSGTLPDRGRLEVCPTFSGAPEPHPPDSCLRVTLGPEDAAIGSTRCTNFYSAGTAFTLIELLVVIAIIAVLIVMPELAVLPYKRFWSGQITEHQMWATVTRCQPERLLLGSGPWDRGISEFAQAGYTRLYEDGANALYLAKSLSVNEH